MVRMPPDPDWAMSGEEPTQTAAEWAVSRKLPLRRVGSGGDELATAIGRPRLGNLAGAVWRPDEDDHLIDGEPRDDHDA